MIEVVYLCIKIYHRPQEKCVEFWFKIFYVVSAYST